MPDDAGFFPSFDLTSSPTVAEYVLADNFITGIQGPLGSGKSVGSCIKIMRKAMDQVPDKLMNMRRSRWVVIRNTYPELRSTTIKTWEECFPEHLCGPVVYSHPITHHIIIAPRGGSPGLDLEVMFLALDRPVDVKHLKSLEVTGAWVNEATELPVEIIDMLTGRVGRYPSMKQHNVDGSRGPTWSGIILDTNAPDDMNWYHKASIEGEFPDLEAVVNGVAIDISWRFWGQPPAVLEVEQTGTGFKIKEGGFEQLEVEPRHAMPAAGRFWTINPMAENLSNLRPAYYHQQITNKSLLWIQRFLQAKNVFMTEGKSWIPEYNDSVMAKVGIPYDENLPLLAGIDAGGGTLQPAAVWGQRGAYGDWRILHELTLFDIGVDRFTDLFHMTMADKFPGVTLDRAYIDPAARTRDEVYEVAVEDHFRSKNIPVFLAPTNDQTLRREALALPMTRLITLPNGHTAPGFLVDAKGCPMLRAALGGKWFKRKVQVAGSDRYIDKPEKNSYSHVGDAAGYLLSGGGEHQVLTRGKPRGGAADRRTQAFEGARSGNTPIVLRHDFNVFDT